MNRRILESFLFIYYFLYGKLLINDYKNDDLGLLFKESFEYINSFFEGKVLLKLDENNNIEVFYHDFNIFSNIGSDYFLLFELLTYDIRDIEYINLDSYNFSSEIKNEIKYFLQITDGNIESRKELILYIDTLEFDRLKKILLFFCYGDHPLNKEESLLSIELINNLIDYYDGKFLSFYLLKARQRFNHIYRFVIGKYRFNKLLSTQKGLDLIYGFEDIKLILNDFEYVEKNMVKTLNSYFIFKGKFLLHLLNFNGIGLLLKYLKRINKLYDHDVYHWIGVYYLQVGNPNKAKFFLEKIMNVDDSNKIKSLGKYFLMYFQLGNVDFFLKLLEKSDMEIMIFTKNHYYSYDVKSSKYIINESFIDKFNQKEKMGFQITGLSEKLLEIYENKYDFFIKHFDSIGKDYYLNWNSDSIDKIFFYSPTDYTFINLY